MSTSDWVEAQRAFAGGDPGNAARLASAVLAREPAHPSALAMLANSAMQLDDLDLLLHALQRLHALRPQDGAIARNLATAFNRRANRANDANDVLSAEADWRAALALVPAHAEASFNLAGLLRRLLRVDEALLLYQKLTAASDDAAAALGAIDCLALLGRVDEARTRLQALPVPSTLSSTVVPIAARLSATDIAFAHLPVDDESARVDALTAAIRASVLTQVDSEPMLRTYARQAFIGARSPGLQLALTSALTLPTVLASSGDTDAWRKRYAQGLDQIIEQFDSARLARCEPRLAQIAWSNFLLAYHGRDDLELQTRFGDWLHGAASVLGRNIAPLPERRTPGRMRIGLVSANWYYCTVGSYFGSWIDALSRMDVDVHLVQLGPRNDSETQRFAEKATHFHLFGPDIDVFAAQVRGLDLDLAIFPELGMDQRLFASAAFGLARRQWTAWGHPVTTGLPTIEKYLSCGEMEPADADAAYRETLVRLPGLGTRFALPPAPAHRPRAELGLPEGLLAAVPQSIFKVSPDNDAIYRELLERNAQLKLLFFGGEASVEASRFRARLRASVGTAASSRLHFLPEVSRPRYLETLASCDLMVDTLGWSGGNSALDALRAGLPIVTVAGTFMRGRQCATMLRLLNIESAIADASGNLASLAAKRVSDAGFRAHFQDQARAGLEAMTNDAACDAALIAAVESELHAS